MFVPIYVIFQPMTVRLACTSSTYDYCFIVVLSDRQFSPITLLLHLSLLCALPDRGLCVYVCAAHRGLCVYVCLCYSNGFVCFNPGSDAIPQSLG